MPVSAEPVPEWSPKLTFVPFDELTKPRTGHCVVNYWWTIHPERGAVFYDGEPQCNLNEPVARRLAAGLYPGWPVVQVPVAYLGVDPRR